MNPFGAPLEIKTDEEWLREEFSGSSEFTDVRVRHYTWSKSYEAAEYVALTGTHSDHILLPAAARERLFGDHRGDRRDRRAFRAHLRDAPLPRAPALAQQLARLPDGPGRAERDREHAGDQRDDREQHRPVPLQEVAGARQLRLGAVAGQRQ